MSADPLNRALERAFETYGEDFNPTFSYRKSSGYWTVFGGNFHVHENGASYSTFAGSGETLLAAVESITKLKAEKNVVPGSGCSPDCKFYDD